MAATEGIQPLEISFEFNGNPRVIHPTLIWDEACLVLIDAGFPGQLPLFREEVARLGFPLNRIDRVIITHQDRDHIGGLSGIVSAAAPEVEVAAHGLEQSYIQGDRMFVKKPRANAHPPAQGIPSFPRVRVNRLLGDGEVLPYAGGITVVHTPGHTPGHICLYHGPSRTLVSGDALNVVEGKLAGPNPMFTHDPLLASAALKKFARFDIETVICYHGGVYQGDVNRRIAELARG